MKRIDEYRNDNSLNKLVSEIEKKIKNKNIFSYGYNGECFGWIDGFDSRFYHNVGVFLYVFGNIFADIYLIYANYNIYFPYIFMFCLVIFVVFFINIIVYKTNNKKILLLFIYFYNLFHITSLEWHTVTLKS